MARMWSYITLCMPVIAESDMNFVPGGPYTCTSFCNPLSQVAVA